MKKITLITLSAGTALASAFWSACLVTPPTCIPVTTTSSSADTLACAAAIAQGNTATQNLTACAGVLVGCTSVCTYTAGTNSPTNDTCTPNTANEIAACNALTGLNSCTTATNANFCLGN